MTSFQYDLKKEPVTISDGDSGNSELTSSPLNTSENWTVMIRPITVPPVETLVPS